MIATGPILYITLISAVISFPNLILAEFNFYNLGIPPENVHSLTPQCWAALNATIQCSEGLGRHSIYNEFVPLPAASREEICAPTCGISLKNIWQQTASACQNGTRQEASPGEPPLFNVEYLWAYYNRTCTKDPTTNQWCVDYLWQAVLDAPESASDSFTWEDLPANVLCSPCSLGYWRHIQSTPYSNYNDDLKQQWIRIQSACNVTYPTVVIPLNTTFTTPQDHVLTDPPPCLSGVKYTIQSGDTCHSIATAKSVSEGTLRILNDILADCSNLPSAGTEICLPESCTKHIVAVNQTCLEIAITYGQYQSQGIITWNPTINPGCSNLVPGEVICVSSPIEELEVVDGIEGTVPPSTGQYADFAIDPPGLTPSQTTRNCGKWFQVTQGDWCATISVANGISLDLFLLINPNIDADCENLVPQLWYCVHPVIGWNQTDFKFEETNSTSTVSGTASTTGSTTTSVPRPTNAAPGSAAGCTRWHTVASGQYCAIIADSFDITVSQFLGWNPVIDSGCTNLDIGVAYCVAASAISSTASTTSSPSTTSATTTTASRTTTPATSSSTTTTTSRTTTTTTSSRTITTTTTTTTTTGQATVVPTGSTSTGATTQCYQWHLVSFGNSCYSIGQTYSLSYYDLERWNPELDATCSNLRLGVNYCVKGPGYCRTTYLVVSGDYCWKIWNDAGLTQQQFVNLNGITDLDGFCNDLQLGQPLCLLR